MGAIWRGPFHLIVACAWAASATLGLASERCVIRCCSTQCFKTHFSDLSNFCFVYIFTTSDAPSILLGDVPAWTYPKQNRSCELFFFPLAPSNWHFSCFFFSWGKLCIDERKRKPLRESESLRNTLFYFWSRALFTKPHRAHQPPASCVVVDPPITETAFCQFVL